MSHNMKCATCKFFEVKTNPWGFCRIYPPTVLVHEERIKTVWPFVDPDRDWCEEYQRNPDVLE